MKETLLTVPKELCSILYLFNHLLNNDKKHLNKVLHKDLINKIDGKKINFLKTSYSKNIILNPINYTLFWNIMNLVVHDDEKHLSFNNLFLELEDGSIEPILLKNTIENKLSLLEMYKDSLELQLSLKLKELIKKELNSLKEISNIQISSFHYLDIENNSDLQGDWKFWINKEELSLTYFESKVNLIEEYLEKLFQLEVLWLKMKQNNIEYYLKYYKKYFDSKTLNFDILPTTIKDYLNKLKNNTFELIEHDEMHTLLDFLTDASYLDKNEINVWLKNKNEFKKMLLKKYLEDKEEKFEKIDSFVLDFSEYTRKELEEDKKDSYLESYVKITFDKLMKEKSLFVKAETSIFENFHYFIMNEKQSKNHLIILQKIVSQILKDNFDIEIELKKMEIKIDYCSSEF